MRSILVALGLFRSLRDTLTTEKRVTRIIAITVMGFVLVVVAYSMWSSQQGFINKSTHVSGTVTELLSRRDIHNHTVYWPVVKFTTHENQAETYTSTVYSNPPAYSVGQVVDIYYDPENPHVATIGGQSDTIDLCIGGLGGFFLLVGISTVASRLIRGSWQ